MSLISDLNLMVVLHSLKGTPSDLTCLPQNKDLSKWNIMLFISLKNLCLFSRYDQFIESESGTDDITVHRLMTSQWYGNF